MKSRLPPDFIEHLRERIDIVKFIGEVVPLKKTGQNYKGLCPFHKEKTPSFLVHPEKQIFKCFGCGESGNVIHFVIKLEGLSFIQAIERLADYAGIQLPEPDETAQIKRTRKDELIRIMNLAHQLYVEALSDTMIGEAAQSYLKKRGFLKNQFAFYGFGYAPDSWDYLTRMLPMKNISLSDMEDAGLVVKNTSGTGYYDRFRNRIIFPIREHREGKLVAFGGRTLGNDPAKYLNTPETSVYHKGRILYGLRESIGDIRSEKSVIVVEGYFDRLSLVKSGIRNVVAPCGTSLTIEHVKLLRRYTDTIYLLFDSDPAGISASIRALETCLSTGTETYACVLPEGKDPDEFIQNHEKDDFLRLLEESSPAIDFIIDHARTRYNIESSKGKRELVQELIPFLSDIENPIDRGVYINRIAGLIGVQESSVLEQIQSEIRRKGRVTPSEVPKIQGEKRASDQRELDLIRFLLSHSNCIEPLITMIKMEWINDADIRQIIDTILAMHRSGSEVTVSRLIDLLEDESPRKLVIDLECDPGLKDRITQDDDDKQLRALAADFKRKNLKQRLDQTQRKINQMQLEKKDIRDLLVEQMSIGRQLLELDKEIQGYLGAATNS